MSAPQPGDRVYHAGEQYPGASRGTATVVSVDRWGEVTVERDRPLLPGMPTRTVWASTATGKAKPDED